MYCTHTAHIYLYEYIYTYIYKYVFSTKYIFTFQFWRYLPEVQQLSPKMRFLSRATSLIIIHIVNPIWKVKDSCPRSVLLSDWPSLQAIVFNNRHTNTCTHASAKPPTPPNKSTHTAYNSPCRGRFMGHYGPF